MTHDHLSAVIAPELAAARELELVTHGRRTGRAHAVRVWFAHEDGALWLRTDVIAPDWLRNLRVEPRCRVLIEGREIAARHEPVPAHERDAALRRLVTLWRAKYGAEWVQDWYVERGREPVRLRIEEPPPR